MGTQTDVSGIVLAGGLSRRLGRDKAAEPVGGEPLIKRVMGRLSKVTGDLVVVVNDARRGSQLPLPDSARVAVDLYPGAGSLGGIFTGLTSAEGEWGLVVACDMPFLNLELLGHILSLRDGYDVVVPELEGRPEPTHAAYSKECLPHIERRLQAKEFKIARFFDEMRVKHVPQKDVSRLDPDYLSFINVNTQEDLDRALLLVEKGL